MLQNKHFLDMTKFKIEIVAFFALISIVLGLLYFSAYEPTLKSFEPSWQDSLVIEEEVVFFGVNSDSLTTESLITLHGAGLKINVLDTLRQQVNLIASADSTGGIHHNFELSNKRARAVRMALIELGVKESIIQQTSFGELGKKQERSVVIRFFRKELILK